MVLLASVAGGVLDGAGIACWVTYWLRRDGFLVAAGDLLAGLGEVIWAGADVVAGAWAEAIFSAAVGVWLLWHWWRGRRRRDRAPKLAGYKARAAIAALVAKVRESARPRPVLRPQPGGAR